MNPIRHNLNFKPPGPFKSFKNQHHVKPQMASKYTSIGLTWQINNKWIRAQNLIYEKEIKDYSGKHEKKNNKERE